MFGAMQSIATKEGSTYLGYWPTAHMSCGDHEPVT